MPLDSLGHRPTLPHSLPPPAGSPAWSHPGERYTGDEPLGEGGMGVVKVCHDHLLGRTVARKSLRPELGQDTVTTQRFLREARLQGQLEHPAVVPVYDLGLDDGQAPFFTMKRVNGATLADILADLARGDPAATRRHTRRRLLTAFVSVCLAVDFAHQHGVVHRDLKPQNVMLGDFGEVYVLDWGVARVPLGSDEGSSPAAELLATQVGEIVGTPGYLAPEQITEGTRIGPAADIYALGAVLFELLTLERLHVGPDVAALLESARRGVEARPSVRAPDREVPPELEALVVAATDPTPARRPPSARALADAIERFLDGERDQLARREAARAHAERAREALARARDEQDPAFAARRLAMQELGRALALEPGQPEALEVLVQLLGTPPRTLPPEVELEIESSERHKLRWVGRVGALTYGSLVVYLPLFLWAGVRAWGWVIALFVGSAVSAALSFHASITRRTRPTAAVLAVLVASTAGFAATAALFGPLLLTPGLIAVNTAAFALNLDAHHRKWAILCGALGVALPLGASLVGWLPGGYTFDAAGMTIAPGALELPRVPALVFLTLAAFSTVLTSALSVSRVRDALTLTERQLYLYAWHLRELLPVAARAATDPTGVRRGEQAR